MLDRFDVVVFDWDGTLIDSTAAIALAIQDAAADLGLPVPDESTARHVIGLGLADALALAVPSLPRERAAEFSQRYRVHYLARETELRLFEGVEELLDALGGTHARMAVATGKSNLGLQRALDATGLRRHFAATRCADQTHSKPHPAMLLELSDELGVETQRILMIGDTTHDLLMAQAAGAHAVGLAQGAHPREVLAKVPSLALLESIRDVKPWLFPRNP